MRKKNHRKQRARRAGNPVPRQPLHIGTSVVETEAPVAVARTDMPAVARTKSDEVREELLGWSGSKAEGFKGRALLWGGRRLMTVALGLVEFAERRRLKKEARTASKASTENSTETPVS